jgi:tryptophanyl-tRNA synthetase
MAELLESNKKLVKEFGAKMMSEVKDLPDFYTFSRGLIYSHRDFDKFYTALKKGEKCAIVSGVNASGTLHLGHKVIFDTNLYFQKEYGLEVFIPISDDESYVTGKVETQSKSKENAIQLAKEMIAYGFDPKKTHFIIDNIYTNIYNLAFKLSKKINYSEIKATYGYTPDNNIGLHFYPAVQAAHVLFPQEIHNIKHVLVPIGPDEDPHLRIARDIASRFNIPKPAVLHLRYLPGLTGDKMSTSKENTAIFFKDPKNIIAKKVNKAYSGGQETVEEHRKKGGNPETDIACQYLKFFFLEDKESEKLFQQYKNGEILSGEVKKILSEKLIKLTSSFQTRLKKVSKKDLDKTILKNEH